MDDIEKPPPVHYGIDAAIRSGSVALKAGHHGHGNLSSNRKQTNHFLSNESLTSIIKEPSLARGQSQESVVNVRVTSPSNNNSKTSASMMSPQISPQSKKIIPLRNGHDSGKFTKTYFLHLGSSFLDLISGIYSKASYSTVIGSSKTPCYSKTVLIL